MITRRSSKCQRRPTSPSRARAASTAEATSGGGPSSRASSSTSAPCSWISRTASTSPCTGSSCWIRRGSTCTSARTRGARPCRTSRSSSTGARSCTTSSSAPRCPCSRSTPTASTSRAPTCSSNTSSSRTSTTSSRSSRASATNSCSLLEILSGTLPTTTPRRRRRPSTSGTGARGASRSATSRRCMAPACPWGRSTPRTTCRASSTSRSSTSSSGPLSKDPTSSPTSGSATTIKFWRRSAVADCRRRRARRSSRTSRTSTSRSRRTQSPTGGTPSRRGSARAAPTSLRTTTLPLLLRMMMMRRTTRAIIFGAFQSSFRGCLRATARRARGGATTATPWCWRSAESRASSSARCPNRPRARSPSNQCRRGGGAALFRAACGCEGLSETPCPRGVVPSESPSSSSQTRQTETPSRRLPHPDYHYRTNRGAATWTPSERERDKRHQGRTPPDTVAVQCTSPPADGSAPQTRLIPRGSGVVADFADGRRGRERDVQRGILFEEIRRDNQVHDLRGALVDLGDARVAVVPLGRHVRDEAHPAEDLDGLVRAERRGLRGAQLGHRRVL
mmetsp:Transcript_5561/g.23106  ORF Transcript_5561/g.23106 Transcript_5561/m.23106 type:complete len:563 (+) Transcript_5561:483-2171(+)